MPREKNPTVYLTNPDFKLCSRCGRYPCRCPKPKSLPPQQQTAGIRREKKGRAGKTVTVITGLELTDDELKALAKQLKQVCGTGGTIKDGVIEIQGDHRETVSAKLGQLGYKTKFMGG